MDPPSFWLQPFGSVSNASFSMAALPRKLALCLRCGPSSFPSCCQVKFTSVDLLEPPKGNESGPTPWHVREAWLVLTPLSPHQEVNEVCHHCKSLSLHSSTAVRCATIVSPHCIIIIIIIFIRHQHSSTGSTKMGIFMTTPK